VSGRNGTKKKSRLADTGGIDVSNTDSTGIWEQPRWSSRATRQDPSFAFPSRPAEAQHDWEPTRTKPRLGRGIDGAAKALDKARLKAIGNANPPQIPYLIGLAIKEAIKQLPCDQLQLHQVFKNAN
jgi:hypothetical protein